jgi:hypothetical protein
MEKICKQVLTLACGGVGLHVKSMALTQAAAKSQISQEGKH